MNRGYDRDFDYLDLEDDSDQEGQDSSEDELDIILHGTPEQKRKLQRNIQKQKDSSSEDEFEKEMNAELNARVHAIEAATMFKQDINKNTNTSKPTCSSNVTKTKDKTSEKPGSSSANKTGDEVYIDSDEEEMIRAGDERQKRKHPGMSDEDLFYDPNMDDDDQRWIDNHRQSYQPKLSGSAKPVPKSDAVLNCPACMTTLCLDCQRHSLYQHQYRAMFVMNCNVDTSEILKQPPTKLKKSKKKKSKKNTDSDNSEQTVTDDGDSVHPVKCTECNTVVAVFDKDEIFHFFNVLASYG